MSDFLKLPTLNERRSMSALYSVYERFVANFAVGVRGDSAPKKMHSLSRMVLHKTQFRYASLKKHNIE
jgi:hypothetical protein